MISIVQPLPRSHISSFLITPLYGFRRISRVVSRSRYDQLVEETRQTKEKTKERLAAFHEASSLVLRELGAPVRDFLEIEPLGPIKRLEELSRLCGARFGSIGAYIEDKTPERSFCSKLSAGECRRRPSTPN
jgi:hypothetical protein